MKDYMTVKEIAETFGFSEKVIRSRVQSLVQAEKLPCDIIQNGRETKLTQEQAFVLIDVLSSSEFVRGVLRETLTSGKGNLDLRERSNIDPMDMVIAMATELKKQRSDINQIKENQKLLMAPLTDDYMSYEDYINQEMIGYFRGEDQRMHKTQLVQLCMREDKEVKTDITRAGKVIHLFPLSILKQYRYPKSSLY